MITALLAMFVTFGAKAQAPADYFPGKWEITILGTPQGDAKLTFVFERKDGKLAGTVRDSTNKELSKIDKIDEKDKTITAAFNIQSYDVTLTLEPVDADHIKGSLMQMFEARGVRKKE